MPGHPAPQCCPLILLLFLLLHQRLAHGFELAAVAAQVVTGGDGQTRQAGLPAGRQALHQQLGQRRAIGFLGHCQRYPAGAGCGDCAHHCVTLPLSHAGLPDSAAETPVGALLAGNLHRIQTVLFAQRVGQLRAAHRHPQDPPAVVAPGQQRIADQCLVGAVKGSQAQMHHTR